MELIMLEGWKAGISFLRIKYFPSPLVGEGGLLARSAEARVRGNCRTIEDVASITPHPTPIAYAQVCHLLPQGEKEGFNAFPIPAKPGTVCAHKLPNIHTTANCPRFGGNGLHKTDDLGGI